MHKNSSIAQYWLFILAVFHKNELAELVGDGIALVADDVDAAAWH